MDQFLQNYRLIKLERDHQSVVSLVFPLESCLAHDFKLLDYYAFGLDVIILANPGRALHFIDPNGILSPSVVIMHRALGVI